MIRSIADLAAHTGAAHPTAESVGRRLYKDTECGISFGVTMVDGGATSRTFYVLFAPSIVGWKCISWREAHGVRQAWGTMPQALREYLDCTEGTGVSYDPRTVEDTAVLKRSTVRGCVRLKVLLRVPKPKRPGVYVAGYAEGSAGSCAPYALAFPFSGADFDTAVSAADAEGCEAWDEANGDGDGAEGAQ